MSTPYDPRALPPYPQGYGAGGYAPPPSSLPPPPPPPGGGYGAFGGYGYGPYPGADPAAPVFPPPASYGARAVAYLIDGFLSTLLFTAVFFSAFGFVIWMSPIDSNAEGIALVVAFIVLLILSCFLPFAYFWLPTARSGQTPGKRIVGVKVIRLDTGRPPALDASAGRQLITIALGAATGIGTLLDLLWPLWDEPYRQAVHDKAAGTRVIQVRGTATPG